MVDNLVTVNENIVAAAVMHGREIYSVPRPGRHHHVFRLIAARYPDDSPHMDKEGFITSTGRFVDRKEAAQIAIKANQINQAELLRRGRTTENITDLFSEDLW